MKNIKNLETSPLILVVDDNPDNVQVLGNILNIKGYRVAIAMDGNQALDYIQNKKYPDLVLLDIMMPGIDGFEVCNRLKADTQTANIPVIFLTALADTENKLNGFEVGGEDYVTKPFAQAEVLARINTILKRRYAEAALRESEEMLKSTLESMDDLVFVLDKNGVVLECYQSNKLDADYLSPENSIGKSYKELLPSDIAEQFDKVIVGTTESDQIQQVESFLQMNGKTNWYSTKFSLRKDIDGKITGITAVARNITEQKLAEESLRENDRLKSEFVSSVSHELRTPLASIVGFSSTILRNENLDKENLQQFVKIIYDESERLTRLIENVLSISRIESGKVGYQLEPIELEPMVNEVIAKQHVQAEENEITLSCDVEKNLPPIEADRDAIQQVLINLVGNAIKFTQPNGKVIISVLQKNDTAILNVKDTGLGIPQNDLQKIFGKFFRVERPGTEIQGTGLGLALVKEIVDFHKGKIDVQSEVNKGTEFTIILPISHG